MKPMNLQEHLQELHIQNKDTTLSDELETILNLRERIEQTTKILEKNYPFQSPCSPSTKLLLSEEVTSLSTICAKILKHLEQEA